MPVRQGRDVSPQLRKGTRTIEEAYRDVARQFGGRQGNLLYRRALRSVFGSVIARAKQLTPVRRGKLQRNIFVRPSSARDRRDDFFAISFGYFGPRPYKKALAVEFGNRNVQEAAALRRSWREYQSSMIGDIADAMSDEIDVQSNKLASKLRSQRIRASARAA